MLRLAHKAEETPIYENEFQKNTENCQEKQESLEPGEGLLSNETSPDENNGIETTFSILTKRQF